MQSNAFHDATHDVVVCRTRSCVLLNLFTCPCCSTEAYEHYAALHRTTLSMCEEAELRMKISRAECREQKEAQRLKEEQRYGQWAAEVGLSSAAEGPAEPGPKKRMTRLEKVALG